MIKKLVFIISAIVLFLSCGNKTDYRIEGKLENLEDQIIYVVFERDEHTVIDTVRCEKPGQFIVEQQGGTFNTATLFFEDKTVWVTVYPPKGEKVTISGDIKYPSLLQVKGGKINNELSSFRKKCRSSERTK